MIIIGERINGMFKKVREAIQKKDAAFIRDLATRQVRCSRLGTPEMRPPRSRMMLPGI